MLSGVFQADFSSFVAACANAEVSLKGFESGAGKVETQLNRVSDSLSGVKIVQQATIAAEAVDRMGGVSRLTEAELARVGATAQEAANKLRAMGQDVPPKIQAIADAAKNVNTTHSDMIGILGNVAAAFGITYSLNAIVSFIGSLGTAALALRNLGYETQIPIGELQVLTTATKEYGIEGDQLGRAIFQLGRRLAGGDDSVVTGLALMGLSLENVKGKHGEELFVTIMRAAGVLHGEIRDTAMADLFGSRLGASLGSLSVGFDDTYEKAKRLTHQVSPEANKAAADLAVQIDIAKQNFSRFATELIGPTAASLNRFIELAEKVGVQRAIWAQITNDWTGIGKTLTAAGDAGVNANLKMAGSFLGIKTAVDDRTDAEKFLATLEANAAVALSAADIDHLEHLKAIGQLNAKNAEGLGINIAQFEKYKAAIEAAKKSEAEFDAIAMSGYEKRIKGLETMNAASLKAYSFEGQIAALDALEANERKLAKSVYESLTSEKDRAKVIEELGVREIAIENEKTALRLKIAALFNASTADAIKIQADYNKTLGVDAAGAVLVQDKALLALTERLKEIDKMHTQEATKAILVAEAEWKYTQALYEEANAIITVGHAADDIGHKLGTDIPAMAGLGAAGIHGQFVMPAMADLATLNKALSDFYDQFIAFAGVGTLGGKLVDAMGGTPAGMPRTPGGGKMQTRDSGGPVEAGNSYLIGKPEIFTPGASGFISPLSGGGITVHNVFNIVDTEANIVRRVSAAITRSVLQGTKIGAA